MTQRIRTRSQSSQATQPKLSPPLRNKRRRRVRSPSLCPASGEETRLAPAAAAAPATAAPEPLAYPVTVTAAGGCQITARRMISTSADASPAQLVSTYTRDGYLLLRSFLQPAEVRAARLAILDDLRKSGHIARSGVDGVEEEGEALCGRIAEGGEGASAGAPSLLQRQDLASSPAVSAVLEHPKLAALMRLLHPPQISTSPTNEPTTNALPAKPHPFKWLRAVGPSQHTGPHIDRVYFPSLHTAWIPLGNIPPRLGSLLVVPGSHASPAFENFRSTYGSSSVGRDGTTSGWCCDDAGQIGETFGIPSEDLNWVTEEMQMGDVVVVDQACLHMSATNCAEPPEWRISCDTRWFC
ncbi:hypothetical protein BDZ88DRAFT_416620 [Geranomyces variabilis]|nr:hypothetical protein BDZ88DRAFT_416620 [Geranomyces variabilis]